MMEYNETLHSGNIKMIQSEMGVTGEVSEDNFKLSEKIDNLLVDNFRHEHDTISGNDTYLFLSCVNMGSRLDGSSQGFIQGSLRGCDQNIFDMMTMWFANLEQHKFEIFMAAIGYAIEKRQQKT